MANADQDLPQGQVTLVAVRMGEADGGVFFCLFDGAAPNRRTGLRQTSERVCAKLPNGFAPNCRTCLRQTAEHICIRIGNMV